MHDPFSGYSRRADGSIYPPDYDFGATPQAAQSGMPDPNGLVEHGRIGGVPLPLRVVIGANGAYWRDFGSAYSMCVVSSDNDPVEEIAVYVPQIYEDRLRAERDAVTEALLLHKERLAQLVELTDFLRDVTWHEDVQGSAALSPDDFERLRTLVADAYPASEPDAAEGLPPDLARILRDPTITIDRDHEIRLADGRTLFEHLREWQNAPSNTASAQSPANQPDVSEREGIGDDVPQAARGADSGSSRSETSDPAKRSMIERVPHTAERRDKPEVTGAVVGFESGCGGSVPPENVATRDRQTGETELPIPPSFDAAVRGIQARSRDRV